MSTVMPEGEDIRRAVKWISEARTENPDARADKLVAEAASRFNLSPREEEFLAHYIKNEAAE
ncbi:MAG: hypothetical protein ACLFOY_02485 [Desulfatibacillaceae bacterium]